VGRNRDGEHSQTKVDMTEQNLTDGGAPNQSSAPVVTPTPVAASNEQPQERMLRQSEVNELIKGAKLDASRRAREEALAEFQKAPQNNSAQTPAPAQTQNPMSLDEFKRLAQEEAQKTYQQQQNHFAAHQMVQQFISKMEAGKQKYPDFETKVAQLQIDKIPELIPLINQAENASDVMYDLADPANAHKVSNILSNLRDPRTQHLAQIQINALSQSIKANETAKQQPNVKEPLSQIGHTATTIDDGKMTIADWQNQPWLRG
jgi:hypothetical protein